MRILAMRRIGAALLLLTAACSACADTGHHTLWAVKGRHNTVYLLGSVHMLKPADSALPDEARAVYARAKALVMELDLTSEPMAGALQGSLLEQVTLPAGETLAAALGPELNARFEARARVLGVEPALLGSFQPWFAAMLLQQAELARSGFEAGYGVDMQLAARAAADHKPIIALETLADQLGFFAQLTPAQQRQFMATTLDEADDTAAQTAEIVSAWQQGDSRRLGELLGRSAEQSPELFRALTTDRNRRWLPKITALLEEDQDYLVVVGAMHLIGRDGLVDLLQREGYQPVQR